MFIFRTQKKYRFLLRGLFFIFCLAAAAPAFAQANIDSAAREADRIGQEPPGELLRPPPSEEAPAVEIEKPVAREDETRFFIKKIILVGTESFPPEEFAPVLEPCENKETTLTELNGCARKVEEAYLERGVIAAVFIPPQDIVDQTITFQAVEAKMGELRVDEHKYFNPERLKYYWQIEPGEILRYEEITRSLELMNKNPDREVRSVLHAGEKPQTTDILLSTTTKFPIHLTSSFDKEGVVSTGIARIGVGGRHNNFLGFDDSLIVGHTFGKDFGSFYGYHSLPVSPFGTSVLYGYSWSVSEPKKELTSSEIQSISQTSMFAVHQDLFKEGERWADVFVQFDAKDKIIRTSSGTNNRDRLRIFSGGGNFTWRGVRDTFSLNPVLAQGVNGLGARREHPFSSRNAGNVFTKFNLESNYRRILPASLQANVKFEGQLCNVKLTPQEELYLGGIDSVRGYPAGDYLADNGLQTNLELLIPAFFVPQRLKLPYDEKTIRDQTTIVAFYDYGYGIKRNPENTEGRSANFMSAGIGLRIRFFDKALVRTEWGFPFGDRSITEAAKSRFHFSVENEF